MQRLEYVLQQQERERQDFSLTFKCFFCRFRWDRSNRQDIVLHLAQCHKFNIGHPDNLVFVKEFLMKLKDWFDEFRCPYCKKKFKDKPTLSAGDLKILSKKTTINLFF